VKADFSFCVTSGPWSPEAARGLVVIIIIVVSLAAWKAGVAVPDVITLMAAAACEAGRLTAPAPGRPALPPAAGRPA
jgi:hypothetical protein